MLHCIHRRQSIAYIDGKASGLLICGNSRDDDAKEYTGELQAIYLLKECWNKGLGGKMMNYALIELKAQGYDEVTLWVLEKNSRAKNFYEKVGFTFDGTGKEIDIGGKSLNEIRYRLKL